MMKNQNDDNAPQKSTTHRLYQQLFALGAAVETGLIVAHGVFGGVGVLPLTGTEIGQLGAIFGSVVVVAEATRAWQRP